MHRAHVLLVALLVACGRHSPAPAPSPVSAPTAIPSLDGLDPVTQRSIQLACISQFDQGPAAYGRCLNRQLDALRRSPGIPSLDGLDPVTQRSIQLACISQFDQGPVAYGECLRAQLRSIGIQPS